MFEAIKETINPRGGNGMSESLIFVIVVILVVGILILNYFGVEIEPTILTALSMIVGWIVRGNKKQSWDGVERREYNNTVEKREESD